MTKGRKEQKFYKALQDVFIGAKIEGNGDFISLPKEIKEFIILILPLLAQRKIASLVWQSHQARRKAKELLNN